VGRLEDLEAWTDEVNGEDAGEANEDRTEWIVLKVLVDLRRTSKTSLSKFVQLTVRLR